MGYSSFLILDLHLGKSKLNKDCYHRSRLGGKEGGTEKPEVGNNLNDDLNRNS